MDIAVVFLIQILIRRSVLMTVQQKAFPIFPNADKKGFHAASQVFESNFSCARCILHYIQESIMWQMWMYPIDAECN